MSLRPIPSERRPDSSLSRAALVIGMISITSEQHDASATGDGNLQFCGLLNGPSIREPEMRLAAPSQYQILLAFVNQPLPSVLRM